MLQGFAVRFHMLATFCLVPAVALGAQDSPMSRQSIGILPAFYVQVEGLDRDASELGLVSDSIRADVEAALRAGRVPVLTESEWQTMIGNPSLFVEFELLRANQFIYIYRIQLEVRQLTRLVRDSTKLAYPSTWASGANLGTVLADSLVNVRRQIGDLVRYFIDSYWRSRDSRDDEARRTDIGAFRGGIDSDQVFFGLDGAP